MKISKMKIKELLEALSIVSVSEIRINGDHFKSFDEVYNSENGLGDLDVVTWFLFPENDGLVLVIHGDYEPTVSDVLGWKEMMGKFVPVVTTKYSSTNPKSMPKTSAFKSAYTVKSRKSEVDCSSRPVGKKFVARLVTNGVSTL